MAKPKPGLRLIEPDGEEPLLAARRSRAAQANRVIGSDWSRRDWLRRRLLAAGDLISLVVALAVAAVVTHSGEVGAHVAWGLLTLPAWLMLFRAYGLYDRDAKRIGHSTFDDIPALFQAIVMGTLLTWLLFRVGPERRFDLKETLVFAVTAFALTIAARVATRFVVARGSGERALVVGDSVMTSLLVRRLSAHPQHGVNVVGRLLIGDDVPGRAENADDAMLPALGDVVDIRRIAAEQNAHRLIVCARSLDDEELVTLLRRCRELGLKVSIVPEMLDAMGPSVEVDVVAGLTLLGLNPPVLSSSSQYVKRAMDVVGSFVALVIFAPVLVACAVAIKLDTPGPVLFRQRRVGRQGRTFEVLKFRSMVADAESKRAELLAGSSDPGWLKIDHDPRVTRVGALLRRTSLDELPQLFNVLRGDMSLVGPRPIIESETHMIEDWGWARVDLTPGITGLWQVLGRTDIPFAEMVKLDYLYVTNWSLWGDLQLILRTLPAVLKQRGVN